jgi:hypothetical protein
VARSGKLSVAGFNLLLLSLHRPSTRQLICTPR